MKLLKVSAAVLNQTPMAWEQNRANILAAIAQAKAQNVSLLCLPELCITGYGCEDVFHSYALQQLALTVLEEIVPHTKNICLSLGLPLRYNNALFNTACLVADGKIWGFVAKRFLAGDGIHYEPRWFKAWPENTQGKVEVNGVEYPLGDIHFNCGGVRLGFEICEDAWVAKRPGANLALKGVDIILNPSASHFAFDKHAVRQRFVLEGSRAFGVTYIYSNLLGNESGRAIFDGGAIIASAGKLVAAGPRFSYQDFVLTSAVVDIDASRTVQARTGSFSPELDSNTLDCIDVEFEFPLSQASKCRVKQAVWETSEELKNEEFVRAVSLGLFDYLRKSRCSGFVVSLSGGADSSACCCLVAAMVYLACNELGSEEFARRLALQALSPNATNLSPQKFLSTLLTCVYQATRHSSAATRQAASSLAQALGATFYALDVEQIVQNYLALIEGQVQQKLSWKEHDLALQNVQARVRAPSVWLIANIRNALLLVTSNRSEAAVGYATMDGDTAGCLAPLGGIDKAFLRQWLQWLESSGIEGKFKVPELSLVNALQPTAELRPPGDAQTDETDLMPYSILDEIERASVLERQSPLEIFQRQRALHPDIPAEQLLLWIEKFFQLWCRNQWKRERYAPSFHLDDASLDPKTWCRFPILSGGYARELQEMRDYFEKEAKDKSR